MSSRQPIGGLQRAGFVSSVRDMLPDSAVTAARGAFTLYGTATSTYRPLPDFLVIGTKKGGTTSMMSWLIEHPNVMRMFPRYLQRKSPHYFDINFAKGDNWYRSHFASSAVRALSARRAESPVLTGEASPYYMFHPAAAERIFATAPDIKLIALLREPVSRAYSNYWDRVATGNEDLTTFEAAIEAEPDRLKGVTTEDLGDPAFYSYHHDHHTYLARGRYAEQLRRFLDVFSRDQLLVLPAEDMFKQAQPTFDAVQQFLGLPLAPVPLQARNERAGYPKIDPATKGRLAAYYAPYNAELTALLGRDFGW
jgi:hypothetical protein